MLESSDIGCGRCKFVHYNSWEDVNYCEHDPQPEGVGYRGEVESTDRCEYFEDDWE